MNEYFYILINGEPLKIGNEIIGWRKYLEFEKELKHFKRICKGHKVEQGVMKNEL